MAENSVFFENQYYLLLFPPVFLDVSDEGQFVPHPGGQSRR